MSRAKDIQRALNGGAIRHGAPSRPLSLLCSKCKTIISEAFIEQHINECQKGKAECGKCKRWIAAAEFLSHFKSCEGEKKE